MNKLFLRAAASLVALTSIAESFRRPAVSLTAFELFLSIWSSADSLTMRGRLTEVKVDKTLTANSSMSRI